MELDAKRRSETGAFYTPRMRAIKALEYMMETIENFDDCIFYDPACGEGALLEVIPPGIEKFGTTLEEEDVKICEAKGLNVDRLDFLSPEAEGFCEYLQALSCLGGKPIVVFTNPPYFKLKAEQYPEIKQEYRSNDSVELFYRRLMKSLNPAWICGFNKLDLRASSTMKSFRDSLSYWGKLEKMFITPSSSRSGLKGKFPIAFNLIASHQVLRKQKKEKTESIVRTEL